MSADGNPGPMRSQQVVRSEIAPPAGFTFNQFLVLGETPYCSTRVRRKFQLIRSAFGDGAIEALEEGKPRPRARNKTVSPRKALLFILRTSWGCVDRDTVRDGGSWLNLTASMADTIEDGVGAQHRRMRLGNSRKVATEQEMMRPSLSTMFARPIRPRAVAVLKARAARRAQVQSWEIFVFQRSSRSIKHPKAARARRYRNATKRPRTLKSA